LKATEKRLHSHLRENPGIRLKELRKIVVKLNWVDSKKPRCK